jgi:hypothetical protein
VAYNGSDSRDQARTTLSIWPERTDARVGLQAEPIGQLAWWTDVGLRSKQGRGRGGLYSGPYDPFELGDEMVSLMAKVLSP